MQKAIDRKEVARSSRLVAVVAIALLAGLGGLCLAGLRINGTHSFPVGVYWALSRPPRKGDMVFVDAPASPIFELARRRGYLAAGYTPAGCCPLIKRLAGVAGDRVTINAEGVSVNGARLPNSAPCATDGVGRPLRPYLVTDYVLGPGEVLLMSEYSPLSFDSRYFGPLSKTTIQSVIVAILIWK